MSADVLEADLTWTGDGFAPGVRIAIADDGRIVDVGQLDATPTHRLRDRALLPGFVNAHSHAFQRGLRGRGETFPAGAGSFWTWREAMYELVSELDAASFRELTERAFREMRRAGITCVGEFHYLHHLGSEPDFALDPLVLEAARAAGIRLVLLEVYYRTGGIDQPLEGAQRRFATPSLDGYRAQLDALADRLDRRTQSLGVVAHSIRAATPDEIGALAAEARRRGWPFHMHVEEQRREIEAAVAAYGQPPLGLINDVLDGAAGVTIVHATHSAPDDLTRFLSTGGQICICPTTEGNLGDGIADVPHMRSVAGGAICLGTDSNVRISTLEEVRWLEYVQRVARQRRGVVVDGTGRAGPALLEAATAAGARALGVDAGRIATGAWADLVALDLTAPTLAGATADTLLDALLFGAGEEAIAATCVGGRWEPELDR